MRRRNASVPRLVLIAAALIRISVAANFADLTVSARLAALISAGIESPKLKLTSTLPIEVRYLLTQNGLLWSDLGGTLQRLVLWDAGYVVTSSNTTRAVQVQCGLSMDDTAVSWEDFRELSNCPSTACSDPVTGESVRRGTVCGDKQIQKVAKCAVVVSNSEATAPSVNVETSLIWGEEGNNTDVPLPTVLRHSLKSFAVTLQPGTNSKGGCPRQLALVTPCTTVLSTEVSGNTSGWCTPRKIGIVTGLLKDLVEFRQGQEQRVDTTNSSGESSGLSLAIWAVATALGIILCVIGILCARRVRHQRNSTCVTPGKLPQQSCADGDFFDSKGETGSSISSELSKLDAELETEAEGEFDSASESTEVNYSDAINASQVLLHFQNDPVVLAMRVPIIDVGGDKVISRGKDNSATEIVVGRHRSREVVLKRLKPSRRNDTRAVEILAREIRLAATLEHRNIVNLTGIAWNSFQNLVAIWDVHRGGDLRRALRSGKKAQHWTWAHMKLRIAIGVLRGLVYLHTHSPPTFHGAIEPRHILLDAATGEAALCGLGNCAGRVSAATSKGMPEDNGFSVWNSPEVVEEHTFSEKSDVYSFGAILVALDTGTLLTGNPGEYLLDLLTPECPEPVRQIARDCLQSDPNARPMSQSILHRLEDLKHISRDWAPLEYPWQRSTQSHDDDDDDAVRALFSH